MGSLEGAWYLPIHTTEVRDDTVHLAPDVEDIAKKGSVLHHDSPRHPEKNRGEDATV